MSTDRDFDRIVMAWLAEGPDELSDRVLDAVVDRVHLTRQRRVSRVPWRFPTMTMPARVAALIAVGVLALAGLAALGGIGGTSTPVESAAPTSATASTAVESAAPTSTTPQLAALDTTFESPWHGYSIAYPAGWTVTPATGAWLQGSAAPEWGDRRADKITGSTIGSKHPSGDVRITATQQTFADGQTADAWLQAYCGRDPAADCSNVKGTWPTTNVAGYIGYIDIDGLEASPGTIMPGGKIYEVVVPVQGHAYVFTLDGNVDRAMLDRFLASVDFRPYDAVDLPPLTNRFTSPTFGYSIGKLPEWTATAGSKAWTTTANDADFDSIDVTGTPQGVGVASQPLGARTFDDFINAFEADQARVGCSGGDPARWERIPIGDQTGALDLECNGAEAFVQAGDRVYLFEWHAADDGSTPFSLAAFKQVLTTVEFDPASAK
jgi:hypothetical protein